MFWGVTLETGKRYSQVVDSSYHLSMAALEPLPGESPGNRFVSVMIEHNKSEFLLCTLEQNRVLQVKLDHCFVEGEEVTYFITGEGTVHLTGYVITDSVDGAEDSEEEEEESDDNEVVPNSRLTKLIKNANSTNDDSDDDEEDQDWEPGINGKPWLNANAHSKLFNKEKKSPESKLKMEKAKSPLDKLVSKKSPAAPSEKSKTKIEGKAAAVKTKIEGKGAAVKVSSDDDSDEDDEDFLMGNEEEEDSEDDSEDDDEEGEEDEEEDEGEENENGEWEDADQDDEDNFRQLAKKARLEEASKFKTPFVSSSMQTEKKSPQIHTPKDSQKTRQLEKGSSKRKKQPETSPQPKILGQKQTPENSRNSSDSPHQSAGKPRKSFGGVEITDIIEGNGPAAKNGKMVHVYYRGTLPNKEEFDSCIKGKAFSFRLGRSEVIKGWDIGISGMKVGGKRKLVIPPSMGYGNKVSGPIPPNSTLHFEVELKAVS